MSITLSEQQRDFVESDRSRLLVAPRQAGKTECLVRIARQIDDCAVVAPTIDHARTFSQRYKELTGKSLDFVSQYDYTNRPVVIDDVFNIDVIPDSAVAAAGTPRLQHFSRVNVFDEVHVIDKYANPQISEDIWNKLWHNYGLECYNKYSRNGIDILYTPDEFYTIVENKMYKLDEPNILQAYIKSLELVHSSE